MFNEKDLVHYAGLKKMIAEGDFNLKGSSVITAALLMQWFNQLEERIKSNMIKPSPLAVSPPKKQSVKKVIGKDDK